MIARGLGPSSQVKTSSASSGAPGPPVPKTVAPPVQEEIDPETVMRKGDLDLHLLARRDTTMESLSIPEDALDHCVIFRINRKGKIAADQESERSAISGRSGL